MKQKQCKGCPALTFRATGTPCCQYNFPDDPVPVSSVKDCPMRDESAIYSGIVDDYYE